MGALDHGILNLPLHKRGISIDREIDRHKTAQNKVDRDEARANSRKVREQKARVRNLLAGIGDYRIMQIAKPLGCIKPGSARKAIYQMAQANLSRWIAALEREQFNGGCAACWAPAGECDHGADEWMGPA